MKEGKLHPEGFLDVIEQQLEEGDGKEFVDKLINKPPLAIRAIKDVINMHQELGLREGRRYERRVIDTLRNTEDHAEGRRTFTEDSDPSWVGK